MRVPVAMLSDVRNPIELLRWQLSKRHGQPMSDEDHEYILWMAKHIERELDDAFYDRNVNGDDSYLKELDKRYRAGFFDTDLFGENPEWDEGDVSWSTRAMALKIAEDLFKRGKGL